MAQHDESGDPGLVARVLRGDKNAYEGLVRGHSQAVARIVSAHVPAGQVDELIQETFVRAYVSLAAYRGDSPFSHWLSVIAVRACHDFWRARYRSRETPHADLSEAGRAMVDNTAGEDDTPFDQGLYGHEASKLLTAALDRLSATDRMVLVLTCLEERSTAEAAALLGISRANVKIRAFRARKALRAMLETTISER
ncbi:RNA polymerase sigma factor [Desulfolutivibrio sulfoxidireducens]|uniref:RNA polymerase sigma factor n=1 Tax=Desulfolutivibrio sulfoxidireducens TaxID=2773299 RepID=UPI00159D87D6|nr:sigma-70 family RNA polymerase sigma factor [Desulfolutivibrio sulfoxidireducens]QLA17925.1 sigma-70 family RNA polymerase sigma factor [Desulfolutivibrio sulfoxidireducens]QLA21502.1 sigma-70 family RNA polymerase sigma factor [Desulfolutivibrio sulfoxidireducens]